LDDLTQAPNVVVRAEAVSKRYGQLEAVRDVSMEVRAGEMVAIMGRSGSGKTTLLHLLGAMDLPTSGTVWLAGRITSSLTDDELTRLRRRKVGFVFQFFNLLPTLTLRENVELPLLLDGVAARSASERALRMLTAVELGGRAEDYPVRLSGGEMQRVAIARALVQDAALVVADEPTGNLDSTTAAALLQSFRQLAQAHSTAIVMATHSQQAAEFADRVLYLQDGRLA
jgi:putative ABC transport system ATP-binding protein